eukprot:m.319811 g.319811  ORF g.319811 m.319811 type:complete len:100 (+) comp23478_c0_seq1:66-365(+)
MSTSKKEDDFIREPLKNDKGEYKDVETVGGIGPKAADALKKRGFSKAFHLLGQFMLLNMDQEMFSEWLKEQMKEEKVELQDRYVQSCFRSLKGWCDNNV